MFLDRVCYLPLLSVEGVDIVSEMVMLFFASFFNVFLLGLNSQFVRDRWIAACIFISFNISCAQFVYTRVVANSDDVLLSFIGSSVGGASGIASSIVFYAWFMPKLAAWKEKRAEKDKEEEYLGV